ncbi:TniQ family protein [Idiomarina sp.]|uniref:TniQ family protein n=1 Tax=Idiomarina sp. TaxID=1874361 RepID=UPI003A8D5BC0
MILPIHPRPQNSELLSSWITRLAIENGFYSHSFFKSIIGLKEDIVRTDVDRSNSTELIGKLSQVSGISADELSKLCMSSLQGEVFSHDSLGTCVRWVLPLGFYHRIKRRRGIVYCPLCLKEDEVRHFRKSWRLAFMNLCEKHGCVLWDHCYHCKANVDYQRVGIGSKSYDTPNKDLGLCFNCHKPLWDAPTKRLSLDLERFSAPYRDFISVYESGGSILPALNQPLNLQVFNGLWTLAGRVASVRAVEVRARILRETGIEISPLKPNNSFEGFPLQQRLNIFIVVLYYLQSWPHKFINLVKNTHFTVSAFGNDIEQLPFWLSSVIFEHMNSTPYATTEREVINAMKYLQAVNPDFKKVELAKLLGIDICTLNRRLKGMSRR